MRRRLWLTFLVALACALAVARGAEAHANLARSEPAADSKLAQAPSQLRLFFTQGLNRKASYVQLKDGTDKEIPVQIAFDDADAKAMTVSLPPLAPGVYTVKWQSLSADDDDYADGTYKLTVLKADASDGDSKGGGGNKLPIALAAVGGVVVVAGSAVYLRRRGSAGA